MKSGWKRCFFLFGRKKQKKDLAGIEKSHTFALAFGKEVKQTL
jgi:hypothetical protein